MDRRTKIVCTLGPASADEKTIGEMIDAGMDVARLNFSHGDHEGHGKLIETVRKVARDRGKIVPILQDLQGPKSASVKSRTAAHSFMKEPRSY